MRVDGEDRGVVFTAIEMTAGAIEMRAGRSR